jgi:hypothetical protein
MRWVFFALFVVHGLIHFMGFAKAYGLAEFPQLARPISRGAGVVWLAAGLGLLAIAVLYLAAPRAWWMAGFAAAALSQAVIVSSWSDAKFGTLANVAVLALAVHGFAAEGPRSLRGEYRRGVGARSAPAVPSGPVTEADLAPLPEPVREYLRVTGAVGKPRVHRFRATWRGRIRMGPGDPWMEFTAEQVDFVDEPARFFLMKAERSGLPVDVFHAYRGGSATMQVRLLSMVPVVDARGPDLDRAETVTVFNDLCLLAPSALLDSRVRWEPAKAGSVRARYTAGPHTISAVLVFGEAGELLNFVSEDRMQATPDGTGFVRRRWSTPVTDYRGFGGRRASTRGEGRWHAPEGEFVYLEIEMIDLQTNQP